MSMNFKRKMPLPSEIRDMYPLPKEVLTTKEKRDKIGRASCRERV